MLDCGIGYPIGFGRWFSGGGIIELIITILIVVAILALLYRLIRSSSSNASGNLDRNDSLDIIKARLAKGEINEQEYQRIKDILYM